MNTRTTLPDIANQFLNLPFREQMNLARNGVFWFEVDGMDRWVRITDHYPTRDFFHAQKVTVHTLNIHGRPGSHTGVPLTGDFRLLLRSNAQYLSGIDVVADHDTITRIDLPDGTTLTGNGRSQPWRQPLPCACARCVERRERAEASLAAVDQ